MIKSLHRFIRKNKIFTVSLLKLERRFFIFKTNDKGSDSGVNKEEKIKENLDKSQKQNKPEEAKSSTSGETNTEQL